MELLHARAEALMMMTMIMSPRTTMTTTMMMMMLIMDRNKNTQPTGKCGELGLPRAALGRRALQPTAHADRRLQLPTNTGKRRTAFPGIQERYSLSVCSSHLPLPAKVITMIAKAASPNFLTPLTLTPSIATFPGPLVGGSMLGTTFGPSIGVRLNRKVGLWLGVCMATGPADQPLPLALSLRHGPYL
jgi:hypothetical protein